VSSPLDLSGTEKPRQIQENLVVYMRLFAGLPGMTLYDAESFWFVSNKSAPGNIILRTSFEASCTEEQIDAMLEQIGQYSDRIDWFVFPDDQPADLGKRLEARGMPGGPGGNWLWTDLASLSADPTALDHFRIEQVRNDQMLSEWVRVSEAGFGEELAMFYDAYARHGYGPDAFSLHYIGYLDEEPVTSGTLLDAGGCATIYDVSTPPAFRHQGFGRAITYALMQEIRHRGYADTWIWSSNMAKRVYQKLGYIEVDFGLREHSWQRR
jgi:GNAT superfamily N-acetyltransferase